MSACLRRRVCILAIVAGCAPASTAELASAVLEDPRYEIRISETEIGANGHTKREVFVFGTKADGSHATDDVIVSTDRASAGAVTKRSLTLGPLGGTTHFTPCNQTDASCMGPAALTLALASAPTTVIASVNIELTSPTHISTAGPCRGGGTVMHLDGNGWIRNGMLHVTEWQDPFTDTYPPGAAQELRVSLTPRKITQGNDWTLWINSYGLAAPLALGIYPDAQRAPFASPGHPGLSVTGNGRGCNTITGAFEIHELALTASEIDAVTVSFEQHCDDATTILEGCFRYAKP